jgi:hypothetical protein
MQINKVDLNAKPGRALLIDEYIEEQSQAGLLGLAPDKVMEYKDKMIRVMEGLDDIDNFNNKQEAKLNKRSIFDVLAKVEKTVSGETAGERTASTAVFIGMGIASRELPLIRRVLSAYTGYRLGAIAADSLLQKKEKAVDPEVEERKKTAWYEEDYQEARRKLLDKNFQKNNPREYLELKERCDHYDNYMVSLGLENFSAAALNKDFVSKVKEDNSEARHFKLGGLAMRLGGVGLGLAGGELINELFKHMQPNKSEAGSAGKKESAFEDVISNIGRKTGHTDSVWHSTNQIFKDHAAELGYKGDVNDADALEAWSQIQTGKAINNSGELTEKVFEGNKIILNQDAQGNYHVEVEKGEGLTPGHLEDLHQVEDPNQETTAPIEEQQPPKSIDQEIPGEAKEKTLDELNKEFIDRNPKSDLSSFEQTDSLKEFLDRNPKSDLSSFEQADSSSEIGNDPAAVHETANQVASEQPGPSAPAEIEHSSSGLEEAAKLDENKSTVEDPSAYKAEDSHNLEVDEVKKVFSSVESLKDISNETKVNLGELVMVKRDGIYHFETDGNEKFHMVFNKLAGSGQNDSFGIVQDGRILGGKSLSEAIPFKQMLYDNLPDKRTSLAKELLKEIAKNKEEAEFFSEF